MITVDFSDMYQKDVSRFFFMGTIIAEIYDSPWNCSIGEKVRFGDSVYTVSNVTHDFINYVMEYTLV